MGDAKPTEEHEARAREWFADHFPWQQSAAERSLAAQFDKVDAAAVQRALEEARLAVLACAGPLTTDDDVKVLEYAAGAIEEVALAHRNAHLAAEPDTNRGERVKNR